MWEALRPGDVVIVAELDRVGRNLGDLLGILQEMEQRGVQLRVLRGLFANVDTSGALGRLLFQIAGAFAEYERSVNRSRTLDGIEAARKRGVNGGRPMKLNPLERQIVAQLYEEKKVPVRQIARQFGIGPDAVRAYAAREREAAQKAQEGVRL